MHYVAYVIEKFPCKTEYFVINEILELEKRNFKIHILAIKRPKSSLNIPELKNLKTSVIYFSPLFYFKSLLFLSKLYKTKNICKNHSGYLPDIIKSFLRSLKHYLIAQYFVNKIENIGIAHIHAHFAFIATDVACIMSKLLKLNHSFTAHAQDIYLNENYIGEKIKNATFVITCSEYNKNYLNYITDNKFIRKLYRVYHGIENDILSDRISNNKFPLNKINIITVARLVEKKGIIYLLKAVKILIGRNFEVNCIIIGDGPLMKKLKHFSKSVNISKYLEFKGMISREEIISYLSISDFFVLPCIIADNGDRDVLPNVLLESMVMGLPVISTGISAIPELIENEKTGMIVPQKDENAISEAILKLYSDRELYKEIAKNAKEKVKKDFNIQNSIDIIEKLFSN